MSDWDCDKEEKKLRGDSGPGDAAPALDDAHEDLSWVSDDGSAE